MALNVTLPAALEPLAGIIGSIFGVAKILVGGIFGLYLLLLISKWIEYRKFVKIMTEIKKELKELNNNLAGKKKKR